MGFRIRLHIGILVLSLVVAEHLVVLALILRVDPLAKVLIVVARLQVVGLLFRAGAIERAITRALFLEKEAAGFGVVKLLLALLI